MGIACRSFFSFIILLIASVTMWVFPISAAGSSSEKPLVIKGLSIGMDSAEAKTAIDRALSNEVNNGWTASDIDTRDHLMKNYKSGFGDASIFEDSSEKPNDGDKGIAIINKYGYYGGYINIDQSDNKIKPKGGNNYA